MLHILFNHPPGTESRSHGADRFLHNRHPPHRYPSLIAIVKSGNDALFQQPIDGLGFCLGVEIVRFDYPAIKTSVAFGPPAIVHAQIRHPIYRGFHAAGAASLERF